MASTYLTFTQQTPTGDAAKKFTLSMWVKKCENGINQGLWGNTYDSTHRGYIFFNTGDYLGWWDSSGPYILTNRRFRDINSFYHIVWSIDSTQSSSSDRVKLWINGVQETSFSQNTYPAQDNANMKIVGTTNTPHMGKYVEAGTSNYFEGVISHAHFTQGYCYDASTFGEEDSSTGEWKIKTSPSIANYGTNGFWWLKDSIATTDHSPNSNVFSVGGGTLTKTEDCPSNVFATNNFLWKQESSRFLLHTIGNTMISGDGSSTWYQTPATLAFNSGKFYWECKFNAGTNLDKNTPGVIDYEKTQESGQFQDKTGSVFYKNEDGGETRIDGSTSTADYGTLAQNDILGVAVDMDAATPTVKFYKNGSLLVTANASSLSGKFVTPAQSVYTSGEYQVNYGNGYFGDSAVSSAGTNASGIGIFELDVPANYTALSTKGLNE